MRAAVPLTLVSLLGAARAWALEPERQLTQYDDRAWGVRDGLPQPNVQALAQTPDGYLWVGTDGGLARFDGRSFTVFDSTNTPGLRVHRVRALLVDREGSLWIGTDAGAGVIRYREGRFETFEDRSGLRGSAVISLMQDRDGGFWFGGYSVMLRHAGERWSKVGEIDGVRIGPTYAMAQDDAGAIWLGGARGTIRFAGGRATLFADAGGLLLRPVRSMVPERGGGVWLATGNAGLVRLEPREGGRAEVAAVDSAPASGLLRDRAGTIWVAGERGVGRVRDGRVEWAPPQTALAERANALLEDGEGNLWVGRQAAGLLRLTQGTITSLPPERFEIRRTLALYAARDGALWVASEGAGVRRIQGDSNRAFRPTGKEDGLCTANVWAIAEDHAGGFWFGGTQAPGGNLCRLDLATGRFRTYGSNAGLPSSDVRSIAALPDGELLVATGLGLFRRSGERFEEVAGLPQPSRWNAFALHQDGRGRLWVSLGGGVIGRAADGRWTRWTVADGLSNGQVFSIDEDRHGTLWFGTLSGFTRFKEGRLTAWKHRQGFVDDPVFKVLADGEDNLWLCSSKGLFRVSAQAIAAYDVDPKRPLAYTHYDSADGLKADQCEGGAGQNAATRDSTGRLWFGTARGVAYVDPQRLPRARTAPPAILESVRFGDRAHPFAVASAALRIPPGGGDLELAYTALWLARPETLRFRYRLDPYDRGWVEAGNRRVAYYTNIPPGSYRFRVVAGSDEGDFSSGAAAEASVALVLAPHWHQSPWVRALAALAALALAAAAVRLWHRRRLQAVEAQHTAILAERSRIARDLHDTLAQGFTGIAVQLETAANRLPEGATRARENLDQARALVRASLADARRAVWDLRPSAAERGDLVAALSEIARNLSAEVPVRVQVNGAPRTLPPAVETTLVRIGQESLTNALRHARAANIALEISFVDGGVHLRITDDGCGFDPAQPTDEPGHAGLESIRERARLIQADLQVKSEPGAGTEIFVSAPLPSGT